MESFKVAPMSRFSGSRPRTRRGSRARALAAVLTVLGVLAPTALPAVADPRTQLEDVEDQLGDAREDLHDVNAETVREQEELEAVEARRAELADELAVLNDELSG